MYYIGKDTKTIPGINLPQSILTSPSLDRIRWEHKGLVNLYLVLWFSFNPSEKL